MSWPKGRSHHELRHFVALSGPPRKYGDAPRPSMRPAGKARRPRIPGVFEGGATQPGGMQRRTNAAVFTRRTTKA